MKRLICSLLVFAFALAFAFPCAALADGSSTVNSADGAPTSIKENGVDYGLMDVERNQVGNNKTYEGTYYGYVFPLGRDEADNVSLLVTDSCIIVYVPESTAQAANFSVKNENHQYKLMTFFRTLDEELANGGVTLSSLQKLPYYFTSEQTYTIEDTTYTFNTPIEEDYYYVTCKIKGETKDCKGAADFCLSGKLLPADQVVVAEEQSWFEELATFLDPSNMDYRPLWVSLKTAGVAMIFIFIFGILVAWRAMHVKSRWKGVFDSIFTIPMVLPPTVCGFILLVVFGNSTGFGRFLIEHGIQLVFSWPAAVLAATVVGFPLMYRTCLGAFEALDVNMLDAARTLGWSEKRIFTKLMLPLAWPSIAAGLVLAFARAMGEFGATLFVAGNYAGVTQTMPIAIYFAWMGNNSPVAIFWVIVVIIISFVIILIINIYSAHVSRYRAVGVPRKGRGEEILDTENPAGVSLNADAAELIGLGTSSQASNDGEVQQ